MRKEGSDIILVITMNRIIEEFFFPEIRYWLRESFRHTQYTRTFSIQGK